MDVEFKARTSFAKSYLFLGVICYGICCIISYVFGLVYLFGTFCNVNECGGPYNYAYAYNWSFWWNFMITMSLQIYFAHVCKLYAKQASPEYRAQREQMVGQQIGYQQVHYPPPQPGQ